MTHFTFRLIKLQGQAAELKKAKQIPPSVQLALGGNNSGCGIVLPSSGRCCDSAAHQLLDQVFQWANSTTTK